jgi:hypothetical protein
MSLWKMWFWPNVAIRRQAQYAINEAFGAAALIALLTAVLAAMSDSGDSIPGVDSSAYAAAIVFAGIAFGIYRRSRIAAVTGLVLYVLGRVYLIYLSSRLGSVFWSFVIAMALVNGVRGTIAHHRLPPLPVGLPPIEQSFREMASQSKPAQQSSQSQQHDPQKNLE